MEFNTILPYLITAAICLVVFLPIGILVGIAHRKRVAEAQIGSAELQAKKILDEAIKNAESKKKEALIEAREDILKSKNEFDQEIKERRNELTRQERRVTSKEESLDKKTEALEKKDEALNRKIKENEERAAEIERLKTEELVALQRISGMSREQARDKLIEEMVEEVKHEQAIRMQLLEDQFKDEADTKARNIIALAIQRCAAEHVAEVTVSVVALPSEEMKGRIIGRATSERSKLSPESTLSSTTRPKRSRYRALIPSSGRSQDSRSKSS